MRWVKLARKKGIPYFEPPTSLEPVPLEEIKCERMVPTPLLSKQWEDPEMKKDRRLLASEWEESYTWDYTMRKVAVSWSSVRKEGGCNPRMLKKSWLQATKEEVTGQRLKELHGQEFKTIIKLAHEREWDVFIKYRDSLRKGDGSFDARMAALIYYNNDIEWKEKQRRSFTLHMPTVEKVVSHCTALAQAPKPEGWHRLKDAVFTEEMHESITAVWENIPDDLWFFPETHLEKRRQAFGPFWRQQREDWERNCSFQLKEFKEQNDELGVNSLERWTQIKKQAQGRIKVEEDLLESYMTELRDKIQREEEKVARMITKIPWEERWDKTSGRLTGVALQLKTDKDSKVRHW
jgi:hypothetical protein